MQNKTIYTISAAIAMWLLIALAFIARYYGPEAQARAAATKPDAALTEAIDAGLADPKTAVSFEGYHGRAMQTTAYNGHTYVVYSNYREFSMLHDPACKGEHNY